MVEQNRPSCIDGEEVVDLSKIDVSQMVLTFMEKAGRQAALGKSLGTRIEEFSSFGTACGVRMDQMIRTYLNSRDETKKSG